MRRETFRRIGALAGLASGIALMLAIGLQGLVPGAIFGAGGCVLGAICGEAYHAKTASNRD